MKTRHFVGFFCAAVAVGASAHAESFNLSRSMIAIRENSVLNRSKSAVAQSASVTEFLNDRSNSLKSDQVQLGQEMSTAKYQHFFRGIEVLGSRVFFHQTKDGSEVRDQLARFSLSSAPAVSPEEAVALASSVVGDRGLTGTPELKILPDSQGSAQLLYFVHMRGKDGDFGRDVWIDAMSGKLVSEFEPIETADLALSPRMTYAATSKCQSVNPVNGAPTGLLIEACDLTHKNGVETALADANSREADQNVTKVLQYFLTTHGRKSFDNNGAQATSVAHVGRKWNNAAWIGSLKVMVYGDGDGKLFNSFTGAVDVAGHEMTHAVVSETAKFLPNDEQGAANEAIADFFGIMVANEGNWNIGGKLFKDPSKGPIRCLADPNACTFSRRNAAGVIVTLPYPKHMSQKLPKEDVCDSSNDRCWIHINATILGHAMYLTHEAIGRDKSEKLIYLTLTQLLKEDSNFQAISDSVQQACLTLYDGGTCALVKEAFAKTGL
jgi:Zn-dependent metalloprotease